MLVDGFAALLADANLAILVDLVADASRQTARRANQHNVGDVDSRHARVDTAVRMACVGRNALCTRLTPWISDTTLLGIGEENLIPVRPCPYRDDLDGIASLDIHLRHLLLTFP